MVLTVRRLMLPMMEAIGPPRIRTARARDLPELWIQLLSHRRRRGAREFYRALGFEPGAGGFRRCLLRD